MIETGEILNNLFLIIDPDVDAVKWKEFTFQLNKSLFEKGYWNTVYWNTVYCLCTTAGGQNAFMKSALKGWTKASERYKQIVGEKFQSNLKGQPLAFSPLLSEESYGNLIYLFF